MQPHTVIPRDRVQASCLDVTIPYAVVCTHHTTQSLMQDRVQARVEGLIQLLHSVTDKSVAVGFGVSRPEQAKQIVEWGAEGVICGSALVRALGEAETPAAGLEAMEKLAKSLRDAIPH